MTPNDTRLKFEPITFVEGIEQKNIFTINLTKAEIAYNFSGSDLINDYEYTVINFYNNNLILIVYL